MAIAPPKPLFYEREYTRAIQLERLCARSNCSFMVSSMLVQTICEHRRSAQDNSAALVQAVLSPTVNALNAGDGVEWDDVIEELPQSGTPAILRHPPPQFILTNKDVEKLGEDMHGHCLLQNKR